MIRQWLKLSFLGSPDWQRIRGVHPALLLGLTMSLFYAARWLQGQTPASDKGLLFPAEDFYLYSACLSPFLWPLVTKLTAYILTKSSGGNAEDTHRFSYAYSTPLFVWLGCLEFLIWFLCPPAYFGVIALCLMPCAMIVVYIQCIRLFDPHQHRFWARHFRTILSLVPQLLIATIIFR